jgi:hypothetical protein
MPKQFLEELFVKEENENEQLKKVNVYVVIDAAKIKKLTNELIVVDEQKYQNLFEGKEAIELEEVAPYLVELKKEDEFTTWVAKNVYGKSGAIFIKSTNNIETLAQHLKPFIHVTREIEHEGKIVTQKGYLAYYDPRVFPNWIESESQQQQSNFFSNINEVLCEDAFNKEEYLSYEYNTQLIKQNKNAYAKSSYEESV